MSLEHFLRARSDRCTGCGHHPESQGCRCIGSEWDIFVAALRQCIRADGTISQNSVRPLIAGRVAPKRTSRYWQIAQQPGPERLIERSGNYEDSTDRRGKNTAKAIPIYVATTRLGSPGGQAAA